MSDPNAGFQQGDYATESAMRRGLERAAAKAGHLTAIPAKEVVKPEPDPTWHESAKVMWTLALCDEAADLWSSGDYLRLWMLCQMYSSEMSATYADGSPRTPRAQSMEVLFTQLTELRLSARAKQADGYLVNRSDDLAGDQSWLSTVLNDEDETDD